MTTRRKVIQAAATLAVAAAAKPLMGAPVPEAQPPVKGKPVAKSVRRPIKANGR